MRTAPLALAYLDDEAALVEAARAVSELTHWAHEVGDVCVLWCVAIRRDRWIAAIPRPSATDWPSAATQSLGAAQRVATGRAGVGVVVDINGASARDIRIDPHVLHPLGLTAGGHQIRHAVDLDRGDGDLLRLLAGA
jgi:hypothetical protein